ncbi:alpha/beta hydrolase [Arenibacter sp. M-2]|uniref:alpha/beta fold hydrolase n=1 Tax=Arenibacter sp. M-2 TaxID=3053612 RepID=UPI0025703A0F|nr:alpha/beta hydrolase [Arenibacter sp. M-2]MDL5512491.1 alpha/beta hydrolase [Arenibacter sp. M-2]
MNKEAYRKNIIEKLKVNIEQRKVVVDTIKTSYLLAGNGYPVVLLHGGGAGGVTWYPSIDVLAKYFQVIVPDIVGYGESDKPEDANYSRPYFVKWLKGFLNELKIAKANIVGLSQGGAIALQFVIDNPERVNKLVMVNSAGLGAKVSFWAMIGVLWMNNAPSEAANSFNSKYILHSPEKRDPNHGLYSIAVLKSKGGKNAFRKGRGAAVSKISEESLSQIENETLIIWGAEDKLFSIKSGEAAAETIPNAKLKVIPNAGHLPLIDNPKIFNTILTEFLRGF